MHSPDVLCCNGRLGVLIKLCPEYLQVLLAGGSLVLSYGGPLGFNYKSHLGRLGLKRVVYLRGLLPDDSQGCAMHGVTQSVPLLCEVSPDCETPRSLTNTFANYSTRSGRTILVTSLRRFPCSLGRWILLGCSLIL